MHGPTNNIPTLSDLTKRDFRGNNEFTSRSAIYRKIGFPGQLFWYDPSDNNEYPLASSAGSLPEVILQAGAFAGSSPAGAVLGVDSTTGDLYYPVAGNWTALSSGGAQEVITGAALAAGGVAPTGAIYGVNTTTGQKFFNNAGNWAAIPAEEDNDFVVSAGVLAGPAPAGAEFGIDTTTSQRYYVDGGGNWQAIPLNDDIQTGTTNPTVGSAAPAGADSFINTVTGEEFYKDSTGNWQPKSVPTSLEKNFTQNAHGLSVGNRVYVNAAGNWVVGDSTGTGSQIPVAVVVTVPDANTIGLRGIKGQFVDLTDAQLFGGAWDLTAGGTATNSRYAFTQDDGSLSQSADADINNAEFYRIDGATVLTLGGRPYANSFTPPTLLFNTLAEVPVVNTLQVGSYVSITNDGANNGVYLITGPVGGTGTAIEPA